VDDDLTTFVPWSNISDVAPLNDTFVATEDTIAFSKMVQLCVKNKRHDLVSGPSGAGKFSIILNELTLSAQTTSKQIQETIETKMESKKKTLLGPPEGKNDVFLVDDIIMPKPETYGAQPPLELIRQYLGYGGFYNMKDLSWIDVKDMTVAGAGQPAGGGRPPVSPRFSSRFTGDFISEPNTAKLKNHFLLDHEVLLHRLEIPRDGEKPPRKHRRLGGHALRESVRAVLADTLRLPLYFQPS
jgi:dynein heavy chain